MIWRLRRSSKSETDHCVAFVVQWIETFEIVVPVVRALHEVGWTTRIVVTPVTCSSSKGFGYDLDLAVLVWEWLAANGFSPEPLVTPDSEAARLRDFRPAAVFLPKQYVGQRHDSLSPANLGLPVHYINYGFNICPGACDPAVSNEDTLFELPFFRECDALYAENDYCVEQFAHAGVKRSHIIKTGHPSLDHWDIDRGRDDIPTVLWCPWWSTRWDDTDRNIVGYSTFIPSYRTVLEEAARRQYMRFIIRPHPLLWSELRNEGLWSEQDEMRFFARVAELENVTVDGNVNNAKRYPLYTNHVKQFEQAWAMVTDGISFLAEFGYTGKPLLLTQAHGNPGWNPVGQAICDVVQRSDGINGLKSFLDQVERDIDPEADKRREVIRRQFFRPTGGSAAAIARHITKLSS
jgi:hypothetical protein